MKRLNYSFLFYDFTKSENLNELDKMRQVPLPDKKDSECLR